MNRCQIPRRAPLLGEKNPPLCGRPATWHTDDHLGPVSSTTWMCDECCRKVMLDSDSVDATHACDDCGELVSYRSQDEHDERDCVPLPQKWPKDCGCGKSYSAEAWAQLCHHATWEADNKGPLDMRHCSCGSTLSVRLPKAVAA